ncbi:MAG: methyltransferase domain-containing protein [Nitrospinae bacterium]|nr:methyltransferase domain-containing protein [Nitrospinota bacterium]
MVLGVIPFAHTHIQKILGEGDSAIDATLGNGNDILMLAKCVGKKGTVYGFDVQEQAIENSRKLLEKENLHEQVKLYQTGHENITEIVGDDQKGKIKAITFNLGYLPKSNKEIITRPETTLKALEVSSEYISSGGVIAVVVYTGHTGGQEEGDAVVQWAENLEQNTFSVLSYSFINLSNNPPFLLLIEKK